MSINIGFQLIVLGILFLSTIPVQIMLDKVGKGDMDFFNWMAKQPLEKIFFFKMTSLSGLGFVFMGLALALV